MKKNSAFYILNTPRTKFEIRESLEHLPVVWNRFGEYRIMPREVVENAVNNLEMWNKFEGKTTCPMIAIYWDQGIPISNLAGRALINE